jgi:competence protein ComEC
VRDHPLDTLPAALPATAFAAGAAVCAHLVDPWATAAAFALCAILAITAPRSRNAAGARRVASATIFLAAGIALAAREHARVEADLDVIEALRRDSFVPIVVPLDRGWERRGETSTLRARMFTLQDGARTRAIEIPITVTLWDDAPPETAMASALRAEGFLLCSADGCRMNVKAARLIRAAGALPGWHPAAWNRAAALRIAVLGRESEHARRGAAQAAALALGRGELLDDEVREAYRRGGTYHLLVFSGMQIALAAGVVGWSFRRVGRPRPGDWSLLAIALVAPPFAGHDPSVSRASVMIGCYAASRLAGRPTPLANLLFVSALVRLLVTPSECGEPGFALTWGATGGLLLIGGPFASRCRNTALRALAFGMGAELGTTPITALFFHQIVIGSSIITLLISPLLSFMVGISALACASAFVAPRFAVVLLEAIGRLDAIAVGANTAIADATGVARIVPAPPALLVSAAFLAAIVAILSFRSPRRGAALAALSLLVPPLASVAIERSRSRFEGFEMTVIDVGQGEAILIRNGRESILVDGGGRRSDPTFGRRVTVPWLIDRGVRRPDVVLITHSDPDHCAGVVSVVELLGAREVWLSSRHAKAPCAQSLLDAARRRRIPARLVDRHPPRRAGSLPVRLYAAEPPFRRSFTNNTSVTAAFAIERRRFLLTGDIERAAEFEMLESAKGMVRCDVLKVAHHGSRTSTGAPFLRSASPRLAAISCGRENSYGHPAPDVLDRLVGSGARISRTDRHGSITFTVRRGRLFVTREIDTGGDAGSLVAGGGPL